MNYYNDNDRSAAAWLRELIKAGLIPDGVVDDRSIKDVRPGELDGFKQCHFFAGIAGWAYALRLAGWPKNRHVWTGSCPCQPFSAAGKGEGIDDSRHLWPAFRWLIAQCRPSTIFGEQVASRLGFEWIDGISNDLECLDYSIGAADLPAACVGAPHIRQRLFWVADLHGNGFGQTRQHIATQGCNGVAGDGTDSGRLVDHHRKRREKQCSAESVRPEQPCIERPGSPDWLSDTELHGRRADEQKRKTERRTAAGWYRPWHDCELITDTTGKTRRIESGLSPLVDGIPGRVGLLRGYGNAIVPQVGAVFIKAFLSTTGKRSKL